MGMHPSLDGTCILNVHGHSWLTAHAQQTAFGPLCVLLEHIRGATTRVVVPVQYVQEGAVAALAPTAPPPVPLPRHPACCTGPSYAATATHRCSPSVLRLHQALLHLFDLEQQAACTAGPGTRRCCRCGSCCSYLLRCLCCQGPGPCSSQGSALPLPLQATEAPGSKGDRDGATIAGAPCATGWCREQGRGCRRLHHAAAATGCQ